MDSTFCQFPDQPCLHGSKQKLAFLSSFSCSRHIVQNPLDLRCRKISIDHKTCFLPEFFRQSFFHKRITVFRCPPALPDNCMIDRFPRILIPDNGGLSLIGNTDCRNIICCSGNHIHCFDSHSKLACPDLIRVVLHPARLWKILAEFPLSHAAHFSPLIKQDTPVACGSRIQRHYIFSHIQFLLFFGSCAVFYIVQTFWFVEETHNAPADSAAITDFLSVIKPPAIIGVFRS